MYTTKVYKALGGNELIVADGGKITMQPGSTLDIEGEITQSLTFDDADFVITEGNVTLVPTVARGTPAANIPPVADDLATDANGTAIAGAVNANSGAVNAIVAALEAFGISLPDD